jgi:acyl-homoserine lactone acylase PvdQ
MFHHSKIPMRVTFLLLLILSIFACTPSAKKNELRRWEDHATSVTIIRDDFGVPHIYGKTDADAVFGMLYAQCEDDFNRVERNYMWAIGRLAEVEGKDQLYSDLRANLFMTKEEAIAQYDGSPEWLKELCNAFADGVNYYLHSHPEVKPKLLTHFEPWMPMYFFEGSIGGDIESVSVRKIQEFYDSINVTSLRGRHDRSNPVQSEQNQMSSLEMADTYLDEPQGSNGFAISGKLTESGKAMLLINPHTSFFFRGEIHVVSEEGLNAYGAVTWGQFFIYQGFNEKNGWMHTSSYTDVMDEFVETVVEKDGEQFYKYGEELRPVTQKEVTLKYVDGDSSKEKTFKFYRTHHGPITHLTDNKWTATAMNWSPMKALEQSFIRTKTKSYDEFLKMMDIRMNSSNNTVYADAEGNIALFQGNFIPKRNIEFDYAEPVDGSNTATDWQGLHTVAEAIRVTNPPNGWIQNCNSTPFTSALEYSPKKEDYPYYMATEPENFRGIHAIKVLTGRSGYTLDKLIQTAYDPYIPAFEKLIPGLIEAFDKSGGKKYASLKPAIDELRMWDKTTSKESVAMSLAHFYLSISMQKGKRDPEMELIDVVNNFGTGSPHEERLELFSLAVQKITDDFGKWNTPWGEINRLQRITGDIKQPFDDSKPSVAVGMASGNWGALASFGARGAPTTKRIYGTYGNSFVAVVEFGDSVKAKSILAGGQSGDPASPHFFDQAQRYADVQFKDVAYYKEDVEKRAKKKYHPGEK